MRDILAELFAGNVNPVDKTFLQNGEYAKVASVLTNTAGKLEKALSEDRLAAFHEYADARSDAEFISNREFFIDGFRLGAQIMLAVCQDRHGPFRDIGEEV